MMDDHNDQPPAAYAVREVVLPRRLFRSARIFEISGTPGGARLPAFGFRTPHPVAFLTGHSWPAVLMGESNHLDEDTARETVGQAQGISERRRIPFSRHEIESPWVATDDVASHPVWPVAGADARRDLMAAQWVAEWFSALLPAPATASIYELIGRGRAMEGLSLVANAARESDVPVPRRYFEALRRIGRGAGVDAHLLRPLQGNVPVDDKVWSWAELVDVPKVRARWLGDPREGARRLCDIEFTPRGSATPEWVRQTTTNYQVIESLLGREFGREVNIRLADDKFNANPQWISLFPQDTI
ncbi:hypothetical protein [Paeniglutamicibacter sp.]|uniref:hypothetical protein n=1 Tax=Paeniglutamicibacter sp. TaxID=1934391 RepID=UPI003988AE0F